MQYMRLALAAICVAAVGSGLAAAEPKNTQRNPRPPQANNQHPVVRGGRPARPIASRPVIRGGQQAKSAPSPRPAPPAHADRQRHDNKHRDANAKNVNRFYYFGGAYLFGDACGCVPYYSNGYGYPYYYYYPPVVSPPEDEPAESPEDIRTQQRATNAQSVARGQTLIGYGDVLFAQGKYAEANDRYRKAAEVAPQLADALFRQAFALIATGRYDLAVRAIKRGLALDPWWPKSGFALDELYRDNAAAKTGHLESLAAAAQKRPNDADLLFLVGVYFYFDGQAARAAPFFQLAAQLAGGNVEHIVPFLVK